MTNPSRAGPDGRRPRSIGPSPIPFVRGASVAPFIAFCSSADLPTGRLLERAGLSWVRHAPPDALVPLYSCYRFIDATIRLGKVPELGTLVAERSSPFELGQLGALLGQSRTVLDYLQTGARCVGTHGNSGVRIILDREAEGLRVSFSVAEGPGLGPATVDVHALFITLGALRRVIGPDWAPLEIALRSGSEQLLQDAALPRRSRLVDGQARTSFLLDTPLLSKPFETGALPRACHRRPASSVESADLAMPDDYLASLDLLLDRMLEDGDARAASIARACGTSTRVMQRRLAVLGTSFRERLLACRLRRARLLLTQTDRPVAEIAAELGYTDASNFSRAFRAMTGCSPIAFRRAPAVAATAGMDR